MTTIGVAYSAAMGVKEWEFLRNEGSLKDGGDQHRLHTTPYFQFVAQVRPVIYFLKKSSSFYLIVFLAKK